jgi:hypothetical protein
LLEPGEKTGYGLKIRQSGRSIKDEICLTFYLFFILCSQPKRPMQADALRSVQEFGFQSQPETNIILNCSLRTLHE